MSPEEHLRQTVLKMQSVGYGGPYRLVANQNTLEAVGDVGRVAQSLGVGIAVECDDGYPANVLTVFMATPPASLE